jgi:Vitamin K epoxide reductase family
MISQITNPPTQSEFQIKDFHEIVGKNSSEFEPVIGLHHYKTLWTYVINCILGLWLIAGPALFDYKSSALATSDTISGASIILFELLAFSPRRALLRWGTPVVAFWLLFAPLIFWSPTPAVYLIDTLIACFAIVLSILVPGMPGKGGTDLPGPDQPPSWTYNPSSWIRRWLGIALALVGFFISRYLAAHQLGYIEHAWDPFFGDGTDRVTGSVVSRSFPISDAGFGSVAYIMEALTGFMGDRARWRTGPWIAVMSAMLVLPLGVTSIVLVIMQPVIVGAWCGLCLISAAALITSVPLAVHEAIAVGQFLLATKAQKKNLWQVFWMGGTIVGAGSTDPDRMHYSLGQRWIASVRGVTVPWHIAAQLAVGVWLMARPDLLPATGMTANCDHLIGAMVVTIAAVATAEVTRIARFVNVFLGAILLAAAVIFARDLPIVFGSELISGIILIFVSLPKGRIVERYAGWDKYVK